MNVAVDPAKLGDLKFGIGQPVRRQEDPILIQGRGRYTDDVNLPGQAYGVMVRSRHSHGVIRGIDSTGAAGMPGVLGIYTAADLGDYGPLRCMLTFPNRDGSPMKLPTRFALAHDRVRFVGDPVAIVVAETAIQAKEAAEAVSVDIDELPAVTDARAGAAADAPRLFEEFDSNVVLDFHYGDTEKVSAAFAAAAHVAKLSIINNRVMVAPMEPRSAIGEYDPALGKWTLNSCSQGVFGLRGQLAADILKVPVEKVRVLTGNVGGSFGMKASVYPEHVAILHAAKSLSRPVKWTDERSESFLSDLHGRDHEVVAELALDKEGTFLALRFTGFGNMGGFLSTVGTLMPTMNIVKNCPGVYRTPLVQVDTQLVVTNTTPISAYRGAGRPEGNYYMERLVDTAAAEMGIDRVELRRRNHIPPSAMPYKTPGTTTYDSGEFTAILDKAILAADWAGFEKRAAESRARGLLRGRGIGQYLEVTAPPMKEMGGLRFEEDGSVTIITGTLDYGQGHWSSFAQVLHEKLGVPFEAIKLLQGDSDELIAGGGTGGSKSMMASGAAIVEAAALVVEKGKAIAGQVLEASAADIEFSRGRFSIAGTDRGIGIMELAARVRDGLKLPDGLPATLDVKHIHEQAPSAYPNGCHIAEVEVDPDTGIVAVVKYTMVNDFGVVVNPLLVEGQAHGGIAQGIGQALLERVVYDEAGQLLTGSFVDYAMPRATDTPAGFDTHFHPVPATTNILGAKGCGEAGCAGSLPAVMNALVDALRPLGIGHINMPATPERVWEAIRAAKG